VLDNCEHLIGAAASMAEAVLRANPAARVMATSREPLRAEGECLYLLPSLAVPTEGSRDAEDPLRYGAVRLFVTRARAAVPQFSPDEPAVAAIAAICRCLDGIPLAIELAAARTTALGVEELAGRLDDCLHLFDGRPPHGVAAAPDITGDARLELSSRSRSPSGSRSCHRSCRGARTRSDVV
jgi:predicted ATPase